MPFYITNSPEETIELAKKVGRMLKGGEIIAYKGGLGVGKTTFTRGLAIGMGLLDEVISPTFTLVNEYRGNNLNLYHFDMYRIVNSNEIEVTGFYDYISKNNVLAVEWSENIADVFDENTIFITLNRVSDNERKIEILGVEISEDFSD